MRGSRDSAPRQERTGKEETVRKTVRLAARELQAIREAASRQGVSESEIVREAVRFYLAFEDT